MHIHKLQKELSENLKNNVDFNRLHKRVPPFWKAKCAVAKLVNNDWWKWFQNNSHGFVPPF